MSTKTPHTIDKSAWPDGPWQHEPDYVSWTTKAGLPGLIVRNHMGALCGYAAVAPGHPYYEKNYDDVPVDVHGGLTYADHCQIDGPVCHIPAPGEPDNVYWYGFDCAHSFDIIPRMLALDVASAGFGFLSALTDQPSALPPDVYRDLTFVKGEVESLAAQLAKLDLPKKRTAKLRRQWTGALSGNSSATEGESHE